MKSAASQRHTPIQNHQAVGRYLCITITAVLLERTKWPIFCSTMKKTWRMSKQWRPRNYEIVINLRGIFNNGQQSNRRCATTLASSLGATKKYNIAVRVKTTQTKTFQQGINEFGSGSADENTEARTCSFCLISENIWLARLFYAVYIGSGNTDVDRVGITDCGNLSSYPLTTSFQTRPFSASKRQFSGTRCSVKTEMHKCSCMRSQHLPSISSMLSRVWRNRQVAQ